MGTEKSNPLPMCRVLFPLPGHGFLSQTAHPQIWHLDQFVAAAHTVVAGHAAVAAHTAVAGHTADTVVAVHTAAVAHTAGAVHKGKGPV